MFVQKLERCGLLLSQGTKKVPNDSFFYLFHNNKPIGKYNTLKKAQEAFDAIEKKYPPPKIDTSPANFREILKNQWRTESNSSLLRGKRVPFRNPAK